MDTSKSKWNSVTDTGADQEDAHLDPDSWRKVH